MNIVSRMIRGWRKSRTKKAAEYRHKREENERRLLDEFIGRQKEEKAKMLSKPCALRDGFMKCTDACIHFKPAWAYVVDDLHDHQRVLGRGPSCRLWRE